MISQHHCSSLMTYNYTQGWKLKLCDPDLKIGGEGSKLAFPARLKRMLCIDRHIAALQDSLQMKTAAQENFPHAVAAQRSGNAHQTGLPRTLFCFTAQFTSARSSSI